VNCFEVNDHLGDAIDGALSEQVRNRFEEHLVKCIQCRNSYEFELLGKSLVRAKLRHVSAPSSIQVSIIESLRKEFAEPESIFGWLFAPPNRVRAIAVGLAGISIVIMLSFPPWRAETPGVNVASANLIQQSILNFARIQSGDLEPTMKTCQPEGVLGFFEQRNVNFLVNVMPIENCEWYGAIVSEHEGIKLAHVVYKFNGHMMYVYQVGKDDVLNSPMLPATAQKALLESGWYVEPDDAGRNVVLWMANGTLCAAVSSMPKDRLLALLAPN
jgi:hypothetical protein